jgi:hypothetical protein
MTKRTWTTKDDDGCEFKATLIVDADETIINHSAVKYIKGKRRYSAFDGHVNADSMAILKSKVAAL